MTLSIVAAIVRSQGIARKVFTVSFILATQETNRVFVNDEYCNVRKEAISRDVEGTSIEKAMSHQNEAIHINR